MTAQGNRKIAVMVTIALLLFLAHFLRKINAAQAAPVRYPIPKSSADRVLVDIATGKTRLVTEGGLVAGGVASGGAAVAGASTSGTFLSLSATAWTGIGAAVVGVLVLISVLRSNVHLTADRLVQDYENPFGDRLAEIVDAKDRLVRNGTITVSFLQDTHNAVSVIWSQYQIALSELSTISNDWSIVTRQSLENLNGPTGMGGQFPGGFISEGILRKIEGEINSLQSV